jgi:hypothetical protein
MMTLKQTTSTVRTTPTLMLASGTNHTHWRLDMSKMGQMFLEMCEDAQFLSEFQFVEMYGEEHRQFWIDENTPNRDVEDCP